jgi:O-antigen/teichoic acid export membrane protein
VLKNFTKSVFIYGFAPTFGKFIGIFLLPIYTRVFTPGEYGVIDLFNVILYFFTVFIDLQIYSAIGRYFNETKNIKNRQVLISTAFWNEIGLSLFVIFFISIFSRSINLRLLHTLQYQNAFLIALLWLPVSCIFTYLSVIMRYEKKPLLFLIVATVQIIVKVSVSLITILIFKWGIVGIFIGQIAGDFIGSILFFIYLKKYIIFSI